MYINKIEKARIQKLQKKVDQKRAQLDWGTPLELLPFMARDDYTNSNSSRALVVIARVVHDVTDIRSRLAVAAPLRVIRLPSDFTS